MPQPNASDSRAARGPTEKSARTRARILDAALELLLERGYEKATMRAIAERAGVSVGNAYYYFESKEELVQAFYARTHEEHLALARPLLERTEGLEARLLAVMRAKLDTIEPYHAFAGVLFRSAADPRSPLNPFSDASARVRDEAIALFADLVDGATKKLPADLAAELPYLLWVWHMGMILFWVHDESPGRRRTWRLIQRTAGLIAKLVGLSRYKLLAPLRRTALDLVRELREDVAPEPDATAS